MKCIHSVPFLFVFFGSSAQVPAVYLCTTRWRNDLFGLYAGMCIGYGVLVLLYGIIALKRYVPVAFKAVLPTSVSL